MPENPFAVSFLSFSVLCFGKRKAYHSPTESCIAPEGLEPKKDSSFKRSCSQESVFLKAKQEIWKATALQVILATNSHQVSYVKSILEL